MTSKRYCVGYPVSNMIAEEDAETERILKSLLGDMDQEEYEDYMARTTQRKLTQKDAALKSAQAMLRQAQRPVCRRDMLRAMEMAVMRQVSNFDRMSTLPEAVSLVATVICLNLLKDGPLHEEV